MKRRCSLEETLQSTSDVLYPAKLGEATVGVNSSGITGDTPLHVMVWRGDREAVKVLLAAGAKIDAPGEMDQTPLHVAVMQDDFAMAEILLQAGARPDVRSAFGDTPAELARRKGGVMHKLLKRGAPRPKRSSSGKKRRA